MRKWLLLMGAATLAACGACASAQAKSAAARPNLDVPPVPPRVIEVQPLQEPLPEPVSELPPPPPATQRPRASAPAREAAKPEAKPETPLVEPPAAPAVPAPAPAVVPPLRTPGSAEPAEALRQVHDVIGRARKTLQSIDYQRLTSDRRAQYDSARLMISQSEEELKTSNFEFARNLADKAERLAKELQAR